MMRACTVCVAVLLTLCACRKEPDSTKSTASKAVSVATEKGTPRPPKPPADEGIDVPTEDEFDDAVAQQITPESDLQKELDKLEQEIGE